MSMNKNNRKIGTYTGNVQTTTLNNNKVSYSKVGTIDLWEQQTTNKNTPILKGTLYVNGVRHVVSLWLGEGEQAPTPKPELKAPSLQITPLQQCTNYNCLLRKTCDYNYNLIACNKERVPETITVIESTKKHKKAK